MSANRQPAELRTGTALTFLLGLAAIVPELALAVPPAPPPPEVWARIEADCRMPPRETIALAKSVVQPPGAPARLNLVWAIRLMPPPGAHIGRIVGVTQSWSGSILAATDRGYWIRVPSERDEALAPQSGPVAVSIRDLAGSPRQMAFAGWSGEPGYVGLGVLLGVAGTPALLRYELGGCFPGARGHPEPALPPGQSLFRLEPAADSRARLLVRLADGSVREPPIVEAGDPPGPPQMVNAVVRDSTSSARIPLADGCDEVTFHRQRSATLVQTSCSPNYLSTLDEMWARPQRQHRQPAPTAATRIVGRIEAPIVAVSDARYDFGRGGPHAVPRGDRADPGVHCSLLLAAQAGADAPIFIYGLRPYCAYYPRDPSGAPFPPPPPP